MNKIKTHPTTPLPVDLLAETTRDALFDQAADLVYQAFADPTDDHIECVYLRLVFNHLGGAGDAGAVTVH
ncbi:hypothetical protein [Pusillimonas sp. ANT_WB101]|uniref:hypothetical protein n=1 Tax=Pusillimonas sp. ANT_WB101 TaxID=2597356 RepID=UPI0011EE4D79|nr:hypothetical protein [Pusillimonas sp. ANT_WB101]KAA0910660.1 hypothetical protein FQ179_01930 [Pusillimonas sp. ANT_WB101]